MARIQKPRTLGSIPGRDARHTGELSHRVVEFETRKRVRHFPHIVPKHCCRRVIDTVDGENMRPLAYRRHINGQVVAAMLARPEFQVSAALHV